MMAATISPTTNRPKTHRLEQLIRSTRPADGGTRLGSVPSELSASARKRIEGLTALVDKTLQRVLPKADVSPQVVHEAMRYCVFSGGKRFRPLLCLGACEAVGAPVRRALPVACALELIHTYSLVHDDLPAMDNADERRGQPTCHRKFGEGNAILIGDALLTLAFELLGRNPSTRPSASLGIVPSKRSASRDIGTLNSLAIIRTVGRSCGTVGLIGGQILDLQVISQAHGSTERALREIAQRKTAALITASVIAGGLAGGVAGTSLKRLQRYGQEIGLAFQLIDDVHDGEGLAQAMGAEEARAEAQHLITRAVDTLAPFGKRAEVLRQLATWLLATA